MYIRYATIEDIPQVQIIARQYRDELGFVTRPGLQQSAARKSLLVAIDNCEVVGFVDYWPRRDGWSTVYHLAVTKTHTGRGVGRQLLYAVPAPIRLKCTQDNEVANHFYSNAGMALVRTEPGKKRPLNVYELRILCILCAGGNPRNAQIARASGMAYGTRHDMTPAAWPYMMDIKWRDYDWQDYMHKIAELRPVQAMVPDYEHVSQRRVLYQQIRDLRAAGVLRIKVCPKFVGAVAHIPSWCVVALSVPSQYAGFIPALQELHGRKIHLLGGSPKKQHDLILHLRGVEARVLSADGNSHVSYANFGGQFVDGKWVKNRTRETMQDWPYEFSIRSGREIVRYLNRASEYQQALLL